MGELRAGLDPALEVDSRGRLKDGSWKTARSMIKDPKKFLRDLQAFKTLVDDGQVPARNVQAACAVRDSCGGGFSREAIASTSQAMAGSGTMKWRANSVQSLEIM